ncbi:MAG: preprotein translocase subunit SecA [Fuerstiella sp.]|nr:preprotein translocase subunit SecA [Fuerstiella sp.]
MSDVTTKPAKTPRFRKRVCDPGQLIPHIRDLTRNLSACRESDLEREAESLRRELSSGADHAAPELLVAGIALAAEAMRRGHEIELYDVQLLAVIQLARGHIAQMQTGEGKTFVAITTAAHLALAGRGVHVMTPNTYLAERDAAGAATCLRRLGMTVGLTPEQGQPADKRSAYDCDVTYGTGHEFGFDYPRDQLTLREDARRPLGNRLLRDLRSDGREERLTMQRGLLYGVVDEADSVLIDDAGSPLVLSLAAQGTAPDLDAHLAAREVGSTLAQDVHYHWDVSTGHISLTTAGRNRCYEDDIAIPTSVLLRPWTAYVEQALRARYIFRRNVHYIVADDEVRIVDETTGRILEDRSWQDGLHQAIEAREGLVVTPEKESLAQITRQRFFRQYQNLCGMTGTAVGCEAEFLHVYRSQVEEIPLCVPSARRVLPLRFFATPKAKHHAILEEIARLHTVDQPVLVGTQSISDSEIIGGLLTERGMSYQLLNGLQNAEEAEVIAVAGECGAITIATNLAGRGTDIKVPEDALAVGGLHVIVAECQLSSRMDRQLIGRCGRQGQPGSAQTFVSAEDTLLKRFGNWLGDAIRRDADANGETRADASKPLHRIQQAAEKHNYLGRAELLRQDITRDTLFGL